MNLEPASMSYSNHHKKFVLGNYVYIPILKNAHRLTSTIFVGYGFTLDSEVTLDNKLKFVTLRDPIERWFAGTAQFLYWSCPNLQVNVELIDLLTQIIVFDGHTRSQSNYLKGVDTNDCVFFNMDDLRYVDTLHYYARRKFGGVLKLDSSNTSLQINTNSAHPKYIEFKKLLKESCTDKFLKRLQNYYSDDYALINNVKFYKENS